MVELYIENSAFVGLGVVDSYKSLIWAKRYWGFGDCEVYVRATERLLELLAVGNYITRLDDDMICVVESVEIKTSVEDGDYLVVKGYDVRWFLNRRIVWGIMNYNGSIEGLIRTMVDDNLINPAMTERKIPNFTLGSVAGLDDPVEMQISYANVGDKIQLLCEAYNYGSKVIKGADGFQFVLYAGSDLDVIFSSEFDNLIATDYLTDYHNVRNVALVGGEGEGSSRRTAYTGSVEGLARRELFVDARSVSSDTVGLTDYEEALRNEGKQALSEKSVLVVFDGEVETSGLVYKYKRDYDVGDVVTIRNDYGTSVRARITEAIEGWDDNGYTVALTFVYSEVA